MSDNCLRANGVSKVLKKLMWHNLTLWKWCSIRNKFVMFNIYSVSKNCYSEYDFLIKLILQHILPYLD